MSSYLPLILRNTLRNRRRTTLTIASVAVSFCLLGFLLSMYRTLFFDSEPTPAQALRLYTHNGVSITQPMPASFEQRIEKVPGVKAVTIWQWFGGVYKDARDPKNFFMRMAVQPDRVFRVFSDFRISDEQLTAFERERAGCVAAKALADKFAWKLGDHITITGDIFPVTLELTLVGMFDDPEHIEALLFNNEYLRESRSPRDPARDMTSVYLVEAETPADAPRVAHAIDAMFASSPFPTKTETEKQFALSFVSFLGNLRLFLMAICAAITFTILLVCGNTLSMSVRERVREIGIMKTLGFTPASVLGIVLAEAAAIALTGGVLGCGLASALSAAVRNAPTGMQMLHTLAVTPGVAALTLSIALGLGLISALVPARNASRVSIIRSLRYTG